MRLARGGLWLLKIRASGDLGQTRVKHGSWRVRPPTEQAARSPVWNSPLVEDHGSDPEVCDEAEEVSLDLGVVGGPAWEVFRPSDVQVVDEH
jgi:hypothetical protein